MASRSWWLCGNADDPPAHLAPTAAVERSAGLLRTPLDCRYAPRADIRRKPSIFASSSEYSTVISPLEQRLSLPAPTVQIVRFAILLNLADMALHRLPSSDLSCARSNNDNTIETSRVDLQGKSTLSPAKPIAVDRRRRQNTLKMDHVGLATALPL